MYENLFHQHAYISVYTIHLSRNVDMVKRTFCQPTTVLHFFPFCIFFFFSRQRLLREYRAFFSSNIKHMRSLFPRNASQIPDSIHYETITASCTNILHQNQTVHRSYALVYNNVLKIATSIN